MDPLNRTTATAAGVLPNQHPVRVLQFGEGNFLRAFMDWMIHEMNQQGLFGGKVAVVQPIPHGTVDVLAGQDNLYTLLLRGVENGRVTVRTSIVDVIERVLNPYTGFESYQKEAENPDLRIVISNTTEAGIVLRPQDTPTDAPPQSFPGKLLLLLRHRYEHFHGASDKGLLFFPCELIEQNGDTLKQVLLDLAALWYPDDATFQGWLKEANVFFNTLVDRIVSGYPREEAEDLSQELGYEDKLMVGGELFHFLAVEGPAEYEGEFPLLTAGFNVKWCDNITPYRTRKVRILNGAHTMTVLAAHLYGLTTVKDCMDDPHLKLYVRKGLFEEIIPTLDLPTDELTAYAEAVLERFSNPYLEHFLLSISLNSVSKWKTRVLPSLLAYEEKHQQLPHILTFSLAALVLFYRGHERGKTTLKATRPVDEAPYEVNDAPEVLDWFFALWQGQDDCRRRMEKVLGETSFWGQDLNAIPGLTEKAAGYLSALMEKGTAPLLKALVGDTDV